MASASHNKAFPPFRLDLADECLWRDDERVLLAPKAFAVLAYLVERAGRLVTQDEFLAALWPETYVQPEVLRKYILEIRRVLQDSPRNPRFIETVPKRGYRFLAELQGEPGPLPLASALAGVSGRLVGREPPLAELERCLDAVWRGERQVVFVTGEAGIGKTSLVDAFHERWLNDGRFQIARGQCVEGFGGKEAYYSVLEALGLLTRAPGGDRLAQILAARAPTWLIQFPSLVKPDQRAILRQEILGATRERMVREFCEAMEFLTEDRPLILLLEDLQWADDSTLDLVSALARRRDTARFLLLGTYRPVDLILSHSPLKLLKQDLLVHRLCREIGLAPLTETDVENYLGAEFPESGLGRRLCGLIHRHSDGNPLFMVALLEQLRQEGLIVADRGRWTLMASPEHIDLGIPETLQQMLEVQIEQLTASEQHLLRAASVAGRRFSAWAVSVMMNRELGQVEEVCETLAARQQVLKRGEAAPLGDGAAGAQYEFRHALYREVLYRQLAPTQRRQWHLGLAGSLEAPSVPAHPALASELAAHFEAGGDFARATRYLILAAANAAGRYAHRDAVQVLNHALELLPNLPPETAPRLEIEILERISDALYAQGEMLQSADVDNRAVNLAASGGFTLAHVNALTRLARVLAFLDPDRSVEVCERATEVARRGDDSLLQARAEMLMASWQIVTNGWQPEAAELCAAARPRIRALSDELPAYYEILYAHVQCMAGDYTGACQTARAGIPRSVETDSLVVYLSAHSSLAHALLHLGQGDELLRVLATALDVAGKNGNAPWLGVFRATLAWVRVQACDFEGARLLAEDLLRTHREENAGQVRTMAMITAGRACLETGDLDAALECFSGACNRPAHPRFFLDWYWRINARLGLSSAWLAKGEAEKAFAEAERALQAALSTADPALKALAWELEARIAFVRQKPERALEFLDAAFATLETSTVPFAAWRVHATASNLHRRAGNLLEAERHRARAAGIVTQLAASFQEAEPLRAALLGAPAVRRILEPAESDLTM